MQISCSIFLLSALFSPLNFYPDLVLEFFADFFRDFFSRLSSQLLPQLYSRLFLYFFPDFFHRTIPRLTLAKTILSISENVLQCRAVFFPWFPSYQGNARRCLRVTTIIVEFGKVNC